MNSKVEIEIDIKPHCQIQIQNDVVEQ